MVSLSSASASWSVSSTDPEFVEAAAQRANAHRFRLRRNVFKNCPAHLKRRQNGSGPVPCNNRRSERRQHVPREGSVLSPML